MKYLISVQILIKSLVPFFLRGVGEALSWVSPLTLNWVTPQGDAWSTSGGSRHFDWLKALLSPIQTLNSEFVAFVKKIRYEMHITGQVIYLEHILNDTFDPDERRIYINDASLVLPDYLYNKADGQDVFHLYNKGDGEAAYYLHNIADYSGQAEFTVFVPTAWDLNLTLKNQIRSIVNRYKQAGVRYTIEKI